MVLAARPTRSYGAKPVYRRIGHYVELCPGSAINNDVGRVSRQRQCELRAAKEEERQRLFEEGKLPIDPPVGRAAVVNLSDQALADLMKELRSVDVAAIDFSTNPPLAVTLNYPRNATGPAIKAVYAGISKAIKAHPVYRQTQGLTYREVSPRGIVHEHMTLIVPGDPAAFEFWLFERFHFHCRKQKLTPAKGALHVGKLNDEQAWHKWCGYAAKKSKQETRRNARLEGGGAWTHRFEPLPEAPELVTQLKTGAQHYGLMALFSVDTGMPKDFRKRKIHLPPDKQELYLRIINTIGELDVPWDIPDGAVPEEYEWVIQTDPSGQPTLIRFFYGNVDKCETVDVGIEGLQKWGRKLLRRHRKALIAARRPRFSPPTMKGGKLCVTMTPRPGVLQVVVTRERGPPASKSSTRRP